MKSVVAACADFVEPAILGGDIEVKVTTIRGQRGVLERELAVKCHLEKLEGAHIVQGF